MPVYTRRRVLRKRGGYGAGFKKYRISAAKYRTGIKGQGGYYGFMNKYVQPYTKGLSAKFGSAAGGLLGYKYGGLAGQQVGKQAGKYMGQKFGNITGLGDYKIDRNSIVSDPPKMHNIPEGIRISHREYISDIFSSINFDNLYQLPINPGLAITFPWLSGVAQNFQQYRINGLIFEYITTSGNAVGANTALGEVIMSTDYNSGDAPFQNKQQMLNQEFATAKVPSCDVMHAIECARYQTANNLYYVRAGGVPFGQDPRLYDLGLFQFAVQGQQMDDVVIGELWATYDISFYKPSLGNNGNSSDILACHYQLNGQTSLQPNGVTAPTKRYDSIGIGFNNTFNNVLLPPTLPIGNYMVIWCVKGPAPVAGCAFAGIIPTGGITPINTFFNVAFNQINGPENGETCAQMIATYYFNNPSQANAQSINWAIGGTLPVGAGVVGDLYILQTPLEMTS